MCSAPPLGGDAGNLPADRVIAGRAGHVTHVHCHPRVTLDILDLLVTPHGVDHDMLAVGIGPGLSYLG